MHLWKIKEPAQPQPRKRADSVQQARTGWVQSSSSQYADQGGAPSNSHAGRQFREFNARGGESSSWLQSDRRRQNDIYQSSSDEDEPLLIITKVTAPAVQHSSTITVDKDGWYDWDVSPSDEPSDVKQVPSSSKIDGQLSRKQDAPAVAASIPKLTRASEYHEDQNSGPYFADTKLVEKEDEDEAERRFYEDFCYAIAGVDEEPRSVNVEATLHSLPRSSPRVPLPKPQLPGEHARAPAPNAARHFAIDNDPPQADLFSGTVTRVPLDRSELDVEQFEDAEEQKHGSQPELLVKLNSEPSQAQESVSATSASELGEQSGAEDHKECNLSPGHGISMPAVPSSLEHGREQAKRLRLYSTLYADFARNPWQWHENRETVEEMFPRLHVSEKDPGDSPVLQNSRLTESNADNEDSRSGEDVQSHKMVSQGSAMLLPGLDTLAAPQPAPWKIKNQRTLLPQGDQVYCVKCRRHFRNTWAMQKHLSDSRWHPYYCKICTVDYPSYHMLYMHYADEAKCRPPELEFGPAKPFLQILAEYQITGQKEAARQRSSAEANAALSESGHGPDTKQKEKQEQRTPQVRSSLPKGKVLEPPVCPICMIPLMKLKEVLATACGHVYCSSCVLHYFSKEKPNCPKCRTPISKATLVPLDLH